MRQKYAESEGITQVDHDWLIYTDRSKLACFASSGITTKQTVLEI